MSSSWIGGLLVTMCVRQLGRGPGFGGGPAADGSPARFDAAGRPTCATARMPGPVRRTPSSAAGCGLPPRRATARWRTPPPRRRGRNSSVRFGRCGAGAAGDPGARFRRRVLLGPPAEADTTAVARGFERCRFPGDLASAGRRVHDLVGGVPPGRRVLGQRSAHRRPGAGADPRPDEPSLLRGRAGRLCLRRSVSALGPDTLADWYPPEAWPRLGVAGGRVPDGSRASRQAEAARVRG